MSRIGRRPIPLMAGVTVITNDGKIFVKGPKGELSRDLIDGVSLAIAETEVQVNRDGDEAFQRARHGLMRTLVANMVEGVSKGFAKNLEIVGVGYRAAKQGEKLLLTLGFSHPVELVFEDGISVDVPAPNRITVLGINKERVGQIAAQIRELRPPEPYKGKGIRYEGEVVRRKMGKTGKAGGKK